MRVVEQVAAAAGRPHEPVERDLLDRRTVGVGIDADLAPEHTVGPGHRVLAHVDRVAAGDPVRELAQAAPHGVGTASRAPSTRVSQSARPGNSSGKLVVDPTSLEIGIGHRRTPG